MKKSQKKSAWIILLIGVLCAMAAYALPQIGPNQEMYRIYYFDPGKTQEIGVRGLSHGYNCGAWHIDWGLTSQYSSLVIANCPILNDGGDP